MGQFPGGSWIPCGCMPQCQSCFPSSVCASAIGGAFGLELVDRAQKARTVAPARTTVSAKIAVNLCSMVCLLMIGDADAPTEDRRNNGNAAATIHRSRAKFIRAQPHTSSGKSERVDMLR